MKKEILLWEEDSGVKSEIFETAADLNHYMEYWPHEYDGQIWCLTFRANGMCWYTNFSNDEVVPIYNDCLYTTREKPPAHIKAMALLLV